MNNTRSDELLELITNDWHSLKLLIREMSAPTVNELSDLINDLIARNIELNVVSNRQIF